MPSPGVGIPLAAKIVTIVTIVLLLRDGYYTMTAEVAQSVPAGVSIGVRRGYPRLLSALQRWTKFGAAGRLLA